MKLSKKWYITIGIFVLFIVTNPTMGDFKDYIGTRKITQEDTPYNLSRKVNLLIFSIYDDGFTRSFLGIGKNFFRIGNSGFKSYSETSIITKDTTPKLPPGYTAIDTIKKQVSNN